MLAFSIRRMPSFPRSLPRLCVALGVRTPEELKRVAERECKDGSTFLEFRLDYLADPSEGVRVLREFLSKNTGVSVLATCRLAQHEGQFKGCIESQFAVLRSAAEAGAVAADVEVESAECAPEQVQSLRKLLPVLISFHDFEKTPALAPVLRRLQRIPADAYKIATTALKPADNQRLFEFIRSNARVPLIALAMSEVGNATRLLSPALGCLFTYAAPSGAEGTAPGQVPARAMRSLYRVDRLNKKTHVFGVIADPVAHSKSPVIHNRAFQARRVDAVYLPFRVSATQLAGFMSLAAVLPVRGFSVTIPHKQKILRYLDVVDPLAKRIGAVNTVWKKAGKWRGANTDTHGVLRPLERKMRVARASILIAGYGGAARAAAVALRDAGAEVTITGRNLANAEQLARAVKGKALPLAQAASGRFDALIHATPVGMYPACEEALFEGSVPARVVLDMVYNPKETKLLKLAKLQGCTVISGIEMLLEQAASQFEIWTGETAPRAVMESALQTES